MAEQSIKSLFSSAERQRKDIEASWDSNTATYQQNLAAAISTYQDCLKLADRLSLFSPNETLEDLTSGDLQCVSAAILGCCANFWRYLLINYRLADLILRLGSKDRKSTLQKARETYERYLTLLDHYEILSIANKKLYHDYIESPTTFSTISTKDPHARRDAKIANFKQEKELKKKLEVCPYCCGSVWELCWPVEVPGAKSSVPAERRWCDSRAAAG
jgi:immunoglobulin-binding protein 1